MWRGREKERGGRKSRRREGNGEEVDEEVREGVLGERWVVGESEI